MPGALPGLPQHLPLPPLTPSQLPWLAQLAASSCGESVVVWGEQIRSLAQGIQQTFNRLMEGQLENTNYVVIIVSAPGQETQSCVIVTGERDRLQTRTERVAKTLFSPSVAGKHQCRALAESMYTPAEGLREISRQLSANMTQELLQCCNSLGEGAADSVEYLCAAQVNKCFPLCSSDGDMDSLLDSAAVDSNEPPALSRNSPKDPNTPCSKDLKLSKEQSSGLKGSCTGGKM